MIRVLTSTVVGLAVIAGCSKGPMPDIPDGLWVQPGKGGVPVVPYVRGEKYGYLDKNGRVSIKPTYSWADDFRGGFALCRWNDKGTVLDESGSIVGNVPDTAQTLFRADVDRIWYAVDDKWGLCDLQGTILVTPLYDDVDAFSESLARVNIGAENEFPGFMEGGRNGYINRDGKLEVLCEFEGWGWAFHDGYATIGEALIDRKGKIQFSRFGVGRVFANGLISVCSFEEQPTTDYVTAEGRIKFTVAGYGEGFAEGMAVVSNENLAGFIDQTGQYSIKPQFERAHSFSNGLAGVSVGLDRWGYVDRQGKLVTPTLFNEVRPAAEEYAIAHYGGEQQTAMDAPVWWERGRWLMIDRKGRPLAVIRKDRSQLSN